MKISNYGNFINEKMGVALPAICYAEPIHDLTISEFTKFLESDSKKSNLKFNITSSNFSDCISNKENYKKFPVVSILLNLFFVKISDDKFTKQYPNKAKNNISVNTDLPSKNVEYESPILESLCPRSKSKCC